MKDSSNLPIEGNLYKDDPLNPDQKRILHPATSAKQVAFGAGSIVDVLPTPAQKVTLNNLVPTEAGMLKLFAGDVLPSKYLWANGEYYFKAEKENLFNVLGTKFGESEDKKKFALPKVAPVYVQGLGKDYVQSIVDLKTTTNQTLNYSLVVEHGKKILFFDLPAAATTYQYDLDTGTVEFVPNKIAINGTTYFKYCDYDSKVYSIQSTSVYRFTPFKLPQERMSIILPAGCASFCINNETGDLYFLVTPATAGTRGIYIWERATDEFKLLVELDSIHKPTGGAATTRQMEYNSSNKTIYFQSYNFTEETAASYRMCTYDMTTKTISIGDNVSDGWQYVMHVTCGDVFVGSTNAASLTRIDKRGIMQNRPDTFPISCNTTTTTFQSACYLPNGIPYWIQASKSFDIRTYKLNDTGIQRSMYHIIKE